MCQECGCSQKGPYKIDGQPVGEVVLSGGQHAMVEDKPAGHVHTHSHAPGHAHPHVHLDLNLPVLAQNDRFAERNRGAFQALGLVVLNVVSSPGAGKTTLLRKTLETLKGRRRAAVIVGDLATENDADRLRTTGAPVVQVTTGTLCHLEAEMISRALAKLDLKNLDLLIIENVGNLVCPASFDLGEGTRVALLSTTEGEDKPLKYPPIFQNADAVILTKTDLAEAVEFNRAAALANLRQASPKARLFETSAKTGTGISEWCDYLAGLRTR
ncbi:MAG: hydrogenase nickel incorporation protein HypB [Verrucomicrobia bacterium]|jgi:hydrogenase nickel incorporation protein HypB|nr:hydrogenase nickel incorporation protein HypB [Verrucomicrobiota bacterium]